ncbi:ABC transporter ATP-binding protein [Peptococcaceae bacterium 1198_IL3148]
MINANNLSKTFGAIKAVQNLSLQINKGVIFGLVGPDGAGKTTLLRMICGLITPDSGTLTLAKGISFGYMPQRFSLYGDLTVMENINFFGAMYGLTNKTITQRADEILTLTNLIQFKNRYGDNLSGGMKQKLALTCALVSRPTLLVLDEPTYGVDPQSRKEFWKILYQLNQEGLTIVVSTPYMDEAELCTKVGFINNGILRAVDSPQHFKNTFRYQILQVKTTTKDPEVFNDLPGLINANFYGNKYHLTMISGDNVKHITDYLAGKNITLLSLKQIPPSMEEVYVSLAESEVTT